MNSRTHPHSRLKYLALADDLRTAIERGDYPAGGTLPTVRELRAKYGATNDTVKSAFQVLHRAGLIETGQGRRTRVAAQRQVIHKSASYLPSSASVMYAGGATWKQTLAESGMDGTQVLGRVGEVPAPHAVAEALGLEPDTPVVSRPRVMLADGVPVETADSYYLREVASGTAIAQQGLVRGGVYPVFASQGFPLVDREETITVGPATETDQERLGAPASAWVIRLTIVHRTHGGKPISVDVSVLRADRHQLSYTVPVQA